MSFSSASSVADSSLGLHVGIVCRSTAPDRCEAPIATLRQHGYLVSLSEEVDADLATHLAHRPYCLLLLDLRADPEAGITCLQRVRLRWDASHVPVLVITAADQAAERAAALAAGASELIELPEAPGVLALRIGTLLEVCRLHQLNGHTRHDLQAEVTAHTAKLDLLIENGLMLSMEREAGKLFQHTLTEGKRLLHCEAGTMYLVTEEQTLRFAERTRVDLLPVQEIPLYNATTGAPNDKYVSVCSALHKQTVLIEDVYADDRFDLAGTRDFDTRSGYRTVSLLTVPMAPRNGEVIGVLQFMNALDPATGAIIPFSPQIVALVEALAAQASVALDNLQLVQAQKDMMESMIQVLATAIDAKSPYTGKHCERVPTLSLMLAEAACASTEGALAAFDSRMKRHGMNSGSAPGCMIAARSPRPST